jgi:hypothetical protein
MEMPPLETERLVIRPFVLEDMETEAAGAMIGYAFERLHLQRVIATTTRDNLASRRVMAKLGMRVGENPAGAAP